MVLLVKKNKTGCHFALTQEGSGNSSTFFFHQEMSNLATVSIQKDL